MAVSSCRVMFGVTSAILTPPCRYPFGRFIDLADTNWDHFSFNGRTWSAYSAGHSLAMEAAVVAHTLAANKAPEEKIAAQLLHAYVYDAFAQHFLTDSWAAGHIRTPRKYLTKQTTPGTPLRQEHCFR